jgi:hypothetical protein
MTDHFIHQIEFRWQFGQDITDVASSNPDPEFRDRWTESLTPHIRVHQGDETPAEQRLFLVKSSGNAAFLLRSRQAGARAVDDAESGRHALVARALIGPVGALTPRLARGLSKIPQEVLFVHELPGQVAARQSLSPLSPAALRKIAEKYEDELTEEAMKCLPLETLVAARLKARGMPLTVVIAAGNAGLYDGSAAPLLWGLYHTADPLLRALWNLQDGVPESWAGSFSTFESSAGGVYSRLPHIVFQTERAGAAGRYQVDLTCPPDAQQDKIDHFAAGLVRAYQELGAELRKKYLDPWMLGQCHSFDSRLAALMNSPELGAYWSARTPSAPPVQPLPPRPVNHPVVSAPTLPPATQTTSAPPALPQTPQPRRGGFAEEAPLDRLYLLVDQFNTEEQFDEYLTLLVANVRSGGYLNSENAANVLDRLRRNGWYLERLGRDYGRTQTIALLAALLLPLLKWQLREANSFGDRSQWSELPGPVRQAMAKAREQITDQRDGQALEEALVHIFEQHNRPVHVVGGRQPRHASGPSAPPMFTEPERRVFGLIPVKTLEPLVAPMAWAALVFLLVAVVEALILRWG